VQWMLDELSQQDLLQLARRCSTQMDTEAAPAETESEDRPLFVIDKSADATTQTFETGVEDAILRQKLGTLLEEHLVTESVESEEESEGSGDEDRNE